MPSLPTLTGLVELVGSSSEPTPVERLRRATEVAAELGDLGDRLLDHFVAAARSEGFSWTEIGRGLGVSKQAAQQRFVSPVAVPSETWPDWLGEPARAAMGAAADEARLLRHNYIGTEHVLLGLFGVRDGLAAQVLTLLEVTEENVRGQIRSTVGEGIG
jgi:hypothetical protein